MKTLAILILTALLTACGSGETTETVVKSEVVTPEPMKIEIPTVVTVTQESATVKPEPVVCDLT
ncbi:hypothetical protein Q2363_27010, partial [Escherichia coli]|nr:hypothetical protein [Escherichia coli]